MSIVKKLTKSGDICPPDFATSPIMEIITGSFAYGVSGNSSDADVIAVAIPPKNFIYTHLNGMVPGFGPAPESFEVYMKHGIDKGEKNYDINIYGIIKYMNLVVDNNPNMLETLFVPNRCVTHITDSGKILRERRKEFLTKNSFNKLLGYAYSQLKKLDTMVPTGKRLELVEKYGFDTKFAYHIIRLAEQARQILLEHDLDLERSKELLKNIREGYFTKDQIKTMFEEREKEIRQIFLNSTLRDKPDYTKLNTILMMVLENHYGNMHEAEQNYSEVFRLNQKIQKIKDILDA